MWPIVGLGVLVFSSVLAWGVVGVRRVHKEMATLFTDTVLTKGE